MQIICWGARGSLPVSGVGYLKYGGDTTCMEIRGAGGELIIIDAGSGIRRLGIEIQREKIHNFSLLFTHGHWDHILGFPFFRPNYFPQNSIDIYGPTQVNRSIQETLSHSMHQPNFPVEYSELTAELNYFSYSEEPFRIGNIDIKPISLSHPNGGVGFRFTENGKSFVFLTDNELGMKHPGGHDPETYIEFSKGADLLIHDAEYTPSEYQRMTKGWGHSSYTAALDLAMKAGVKRFGLFHHNTDRTDIQQDSIVQKCQIIAKHQEIKLTCFGVTQDMLMIL